MNSEDRFGLQGHPEVRDARRMAFGTGSVAILLLIGLVFYGVTTALAAKSWPGVLGGVLGVGGALLGVWQWWLTRDRDLAWDSSRYFAWYGVGYLLMKSWGHLDGQGIDPAALIIPIGLSLAAPFLIWSIMRQKEN